MYIKIGVDPIATWSPKELRNCVYENKLLMGTIFVNFNVMYNNINIDRLEIMYEL